MEMVSALIVPLVMCLIGCALLFSKKDMFTVFIEGAKDGVDTSVRLLPALVALLAAISMFNASGASLALSNMLVPLAVKIGIPGEIIPLVLVRPLSGGASTALIADIFTKYGADSFVGRCTSVIAGSTDTVLYVISVYFGAVGIKKTRGTLPISFIIAFFSVFLAVFLCRFFFGM